jgi:hypothetical protein
LDQGWEQHPPATFSGELLLHHGNFNPSAREDTRPNRRGVKPSLFKKFVVINTADLI